MTKEELKRYGALKQEALHLRRMLEDACSLPGRTLDGMPDAGRRGDPTACAAEKVGALNERIRAAEGQMQRIESAIDGLNSPLDREVMRRRYIEGLAWAQVGRLLHYSESHVRRIHDKALKRMNREPA